MTNFLIVFVVILSALSAFTQGTVSFNLRLSGTSHVYAPRLGNESLAQIGQGSNDAVPSGTTDWSGWTAIGANGLTGQYGAQNTYTSLLGGPGSNAAESTLLPGTLNFFAGGTNTATTFRTGTTAGANAPATAAFFNIPPDATIASFEVVAWDNSSGNYSTWSLAEAAWENGLIAAGKSGEFTIKNIGGTVNTPPPLFPVGGDGSAVQMQSFNLYIIPEPSALALATLLGAAALSLLHRQGRRSKRPAL